MSKPYTEQNLSDLFDEDLIWRRRELTDMKASVKAADVPAKLVMLRALVTMSYAHDEEDGCACANRYFEYSAIRRKRYTELERQIYVNAFLSRLDSISRSRASVEMRCQLINDILDGREGNFRYVNQALIDTKSNLNSD